MSKCPLCESVKTGIAYTYNDMVIYRCMVCGMMFQDPQKLPAEGMRLAKGMYAKYFSRIEHHLSLNKTRLKRIRSFLKKGFNGLDVLEIGTGSGALGSLLIKEGASYCGLEPSVEFYDNMVNNFPELQNRVLNSPYEEKDFAGRSFDLVIIIDTLEHIAYPLEFIEKMKERLKENGILYIEAPNESMMVFKGWLRKSFNIYSGYPTNPDHVNLFTSSTLAGLLAAAGFRRSSVLQATVWGDEQRLAIAFNKDRLSGWMKLASSFFRLTGIDLMLQQGVLVSVSPEVP